MIDAKVISSMINQCDGWCGEIKTNKMANLIYDNKMKVTVEIGVWCGRSFFPQAYAHKVANIEGMAYGIDPWINYTVVGHEELGDVSKYDLEGIYNGVMEKVKTFELEKYATIIRKKSIDAVDMFENEQIDLLHIDGNHGTEATMNDMKLYYPKIKKGGIIWFDDGDWDTVRPVIEYAKSICTLKEVCMTNVIFEK